MMNRLDIVRAWKDEEYRSSLSDAERAALPENPAGMVEMHDAQLEGAAGGMQPAGIHTNRLFCGPRTALCPRRSVGVRVCQTAPIICKKVSLAACKITVVGCPQFTLGGCPQVSLACPQG